MLLRQIIAKGYTIPRRVGREDIVAPKRSADDGNAAASYRLEEILRAERTAAADADANAKHSHNKIIYDETRS